MDFRDPLLRTLLTVAPVCDIELERFLTRARSQLIERAFAPEPATGDDALEFWCALASQCFINEYVYAQDESERTLAHQLRQSLEHSLNTSGEIMPLHVAAAGACFPLWTLPEASDLPKRTWAAPVKRLLTLHVEEPLEEAADKPSIPALTPIDDSISLAVQEQYEENPYPRWVATPASSPFASFGNYLRSALPWTDIRSQARDFLVAGCGTGQHAIDVARRTRDARVLAIDLSRTSLAYARRKTRAMEVPNIDYAQADILRIAGIGQTFDVIESGGVLHHLRDPFAGARALSALLRPGGFLFLGLYSERGRQGVAAARAFIAERGYRANADDIRRFRQDAISAGLPLGNLLTSPDFFSMSGCRDLFFHAKEHRMSLPEIAALLSECDLEFLGFHLDAQTLAQFRHRHSAADALLDLNLWDAFERDHPGTFGTMYQFWARKRS
jgi:SAM-dependent methyltransferase